MPNYVTNIVRFNDTDDAKAKEIMCRVKSDMSDFDFNRIIPMPDDLKNIRWPATVLPDADYAKELAKAKIKQEKFALDVGFPISESMQKEFLEKYDADNWYDWSNRHWHTKWNAVDAVVHDRSFVFDTAWSTPMGVLMELSKIFPDVQFDVQYADEDIGSNCGEYALLNNTLISEIDREGDMEFASTIKLYPNTQN